MKFAQTNYYIFLENILNDLEESSLISGTFYQPTVNFQ